MSWSEVFLHLETLNRFLACGFEIARRCRRWCDLNQQGAVGISEDLADLPGHGVEEITILFRIMQETGPAVDLFRRACARFDRAMVRTI